MNGIPAVSPACVDGISLAPATSAAAAAEPAAAAARTAAEATTARAIAAGGSARGGSAALHLAEVLRALRAVGARRFIAIQLIARRRRETARARARALDRRGAPARAHTAIAAAPISLVVLL